MPRTIFGMLHDAFHSGIRGVSVSSIMATKILASLAALFDSYS